MDEYKLRKQQLPRAQVIHVKQQLRWHNTIQNVWEDYRLFNQPTDKFLELQHYFQLNLDETCIMGSLGSLKIVGSAEVK